MPATKSRGRAKSQKQAIADLGRDVERSLRMSASEEMRLLMARYEKGLRALTHDLEILYSRYSMGGKLTYTDFMKFKLDAQVAHMAGERLGELGQELNRDLERSMIRLYQDSYNQFAWSLDSTTPPNVEFKYGMPLELSIKQIIGVEWQEAMFSERIGLITSDAKKVIQSRFENALVQGYSAYDLGRDIRSSVGIAEDERLATRPLASRAKWRADMIARTELMRAANLAQKKVYQDNAHLVEDRVWTTRPANQYLRGVRRLCENCEARRDKTEDEVRKIASAQGLPLEPPIHPHCSCVWRMEPKAWKDLMTKDLAAKVKFADEYEMKYRDPKTGEVVNYTPPSFDDWMSDYSREVEN